MDKIYFNLTKIMNGWILNYSPSFPDASTMTPVPQEKHFKTFSEAYKFISEHVDAVKKFDSMTLRHLFKEGYEVTGESMDGDGNHEVILTNVKKEKNIEAINPIPGVDAFEFVLSDGTKIEIAGYMLEQIKNVRKD